MQKPQSLALVLHKVLTICRKKFPDLVIISKTTIPLEFLSITQERKLLSFFTSLFIQVQQSYASTISTNKPAYVLLQLAKTQEAFEVICIDGGKKQKQLLLKDNNATNESFVHVQQLLTQGKKFGKIIKYQLPLTRSVYNHDF